MSHSRMNRQNVVFDTEISEDLGMITERSLLMRALLTSEALLPRLSSSSLLRV